MNLQLFAFNNAVLKVKDTGKKSTLPTMNLATSVASNVGAGAIGATTGVLQSAVANAAKNIGTAGTTSAAKNTTAGTATSGAAKVGNAATHVMNSAMANVAQNNANDALGKVTSMASPSISADTMATINSKFTTPTAYDEAMEFTNALRDKISSGRTSHTKQVQEMMNKIQNREKFSYDVENDTLFQQALASAMGSGKQAMQDTMGQASALTGGYGSTYATSAGNQAYNAYIEDAYNNLPEYYQMALDAYNMEGQDMYNQLAMLNDADATEYQRAYDAWNVNYTTAQDMYNEAYNEWQDSVNNAYNSANLQLNQQGMAYDQAYNNYQALANNADTLYNREYQNYWNNIDNQYRYDAMENNNKQAEIDRQREDDQFKARDDLNGDGKVDYADQLVQEDAGDTSSGTYKEPTETQMKKALEAFNTGGEDAYFQYLDSLPSNIDVEAIDAYVNGDGAGNNGYGRLPLEKRTFTKVDDTTNWFGGTDNNDIVEDQYGNKYRIDELPEGIRKELSKLKKGSSYSAK